MKLEELVEKLDPALRDAILEEIDVFQSAKKREKAQVDFMEYVKMMWPGFIHGRHHALDRKSTRLNSSH